MGLTREVLVSAVVCPGNDVLTKVPLAAIPKYGALPSGGSGLGAFAMVRGALPHDAPDPDYPAPADVRDGVAYDYGDLVGTLESGRGGGNTCF